MKGTLINPICDEKINVEDLSGICLQFIFSMCSENVFCLVFRMFKQFGLAVVEFFLVCLCTCKCSRDRFCMICITAYVTSNVIDINLCQSEELFIKTEGMGCVCKTIIGVHLLYCAAENDNVWCPIQKSHNVALNIATTKYVVSSDIDFISDSNASTNNKYTFVIPEFEYVSCVKDINNNQINNKTELIEEYKHRTATPFEMVKFKISHFSANYLKWFNKETQNIDHYTAHYQLYCELYIIVKNDGYLSRYDGRFNDYGFNKIVYIKGLGAVDGDNFNVLMMDLYLSSLHTTSKDFSIKTCGNKNARKRRKTNMLGRVCKQVMNGCSDANVCVLRHFCVGSRQIYHLC